MAYDIIGNIAILKARRDNKQKALRLMKQNKNISTVLEKTDKVKGRLRTIKTRWLAGIKNKEALYKENDCLFRLNVEKCYFSSRLAGERAEIAGKIKKDDKVLVLFGGVAPFAIVIARKTGAKVVSVELGKACCKYAKENVKLNKLKNVEIIQGDVKKLGKLLGKQKFDKVIMPRPQIKESFLSYVIPFVKRGSQVYYYDFGRQEELGKILAKIKKDFKKKYRVVGIKRAGEIAPYKFRFRVDIMVN